MYSGLKAIVKSLLPSVTFVIFIAVNLATATANPGRSAPPATEDSDANTTVANELEKFRSVGLSVMDAIKIAETRSPGARVVDVSFDGQSETSVYRIKTYRRGKITIGTVDASTGQLSHKEIDKPVWSLDDVDRIELSKFEKMEISFSDIVPIAEKFSSGSAVSAGLLDDHGQLIFSVVILVHGGLEQILVSPDKARRSARTHQAKLFKTFQKSRLPL